MSAKAKRFYEFEGFRLDADGPSLWRGKQRVSISPKALGILTLLIEENGEIVSREDLLEKVWKGAFVEEGNINYTVSLVRKTLRETLGDKEMIETISGHGYRFLGEVSRVVQNGNSLQITNESQGESHFPPQSTPTLAQRKHASRPVFLTMALTSVVLFGFLAFSWRSIKTSGSPRSEIRAATPNTESLLAYKRGKLILDDKDVEGRAQKALDEFQQAVTLDPTFALAYTGLAEGFASKAAGLPHDKSRDIYLKAHAAVDKAFSLDQNLFEAFLVRGWLRRNGDWDWNGAENDLRRAIELNPNSALAHYRYSQLLSNTGRHSEALDEIQQADALEPLSEMIMGGHFPLLEGAGEYDRALKLAEEYLQNNSDSTFAKRAYGTFLYHKGDYAKVIESGESELAKSGNHRPYYWLSLLAATYSKTGQREKADALLTELSTQSGTDQKALYSLAMNYAELGRTAEALTALESCFALHEQRIMWLGVEPRFANLKNEPRFRQLLGKMGLSWL